MSKDYSVGFRNFKYCLVSKWGTVSPIALPGAMKISIKPKTTSRTVTARLDSGNVTERTETYGAGSTATLSIISLPDSFLTDVLGYIKGADNVLIEGDRKIVHFSLLYETQGLIEPTRHILLDCVCSKPDFDVTTMSNNIGIDARTLSITCDPHIDSTTKKAYYHKSVKRSENSTLYDNWFGLAVNA